ncbi:MAG TPA: DUF1345 domain-containing protein [Pseudomonadales bacterium]|nr:DUF1345 domain-containing protein [Pseudomonadales bacterium]
MLTSALTLVAIQPNLAAHVTTRLLIAWNAGIGLYLMMSLKMVMQSTHEHIRLRACIQYEGRIVVLVGVMMATLACLAAIFAELTVVKQAQGALRYGHIALAAGTIASSWLFIHLMFALHYAHDFYIDHGEGIQRGLIFPGESQPDYADFLYFACVIGTSGQTADVSFASPQMRRVGLVHCVLAYVFNTTVLALTINIASGLVG